MSTWPTRTVPVTRPTGLVSCMRFRQRTNVDLPQPEGADERRGMIRGNPQADALQGMVGAVPRIQIRHFDFYAH